MSLKMPKQVLKSKGFVVNIFSSLESWHLRFCGSTDSVAAMVCNSWYFNQLQHVGSYHQTYSCFRLIKDASLYVQIQRALQTGVALRMPFICKHGTVYNILMFLQVGGFTAERLTSIPHAHFANVVSHSLHWIWNNTADKKQWSGVEGKGSLTM